MVTKCDWPQAAWNNGRPCTDDAVGELFQVNDGNSELHPRCHAHTMFGADASHPRTLFRIYPREPTFISYPPHPLSEQAMGKGKRNKEQGNSAPTEGRGAEVNDAPAPQGPAPQAQESKTGPSDAQAQILGSLQKLGGKDVSSIKIVEDLGGLETFGPRQKVRTAMVKLEELGYVTRTKTGVKYAFNITDNGTTFLASRASVAAA